MKHLILIIILALSLWALWPPSDASTATTLGTSPSAKSALAPSVKYVIRMDPGPLYLPGVVPENAPRPVSGMTQVAAEFAKLYPDTRIEFIGCPEGTREWLVTQLSSAQAPDIIQVNARDAWQDTQKNWYIPLDKYLEAPNPFVQPGLPGSARWWDMFKYAVHTQSTRAPDGNVYCISLDLIETGIFYNKTLFDKLKLHVPQTWVEFLDIQKKLKSAGYTPLLIDKRDLSDWGVDLVFDQVYGSLRPLLDLNYDPRRGEDLNGYLDWDEIIFLHRHGFFTPHDPRWRETWRILKAWRPYLSPDLTNTDFHKSFVTQQGAMFWYSSMGVPRLLNDPNLGFQWGLFYLPPIPKSYCRFCDSHPMSTIAGVAMQYHITNTVLSDTPASFPFDQRIEKSQRLKRTIAFLQFLTTPKSCDTVVNEIVAFIPNIKGVAPHPELQPFDDFLHRHYSMTKWDFTFDLQFDELLTRMFELYMNDGMTEDQFLEWIDRDINTAADTMTRRKSLDFTALDRAWKSHAYMLPNYSELPPEALQ